MIENIQYYLDGIEYFLAFNWQWPMLFLMVAFVLYKIYAGYWQYVDDGKFVHECTSKFLDDIKIINNLCPTVLIIQAIFILAGYTSIIVFIKLLCISVYVLFSVIVAILICTMIVMSAKRKRRERLCFNKLQDDV